MDQLTARLYNWIESFDQPVQLATDSLSWDWPWIQEIFCLPGTWPENLDSKPASLYDLIDSPYLERGVEYAFANHVPKLRRHHALDDAKANRHAYLAWQATKNGNPLCVCFSPLLHPTQPAQSAKPLTLALKKGAP